MHFLLKMLRFLSDLVVYIKPKLVILAVLWPILLFTQPLDVTISASAGILINAESGAVLFEKNADALKFPGSITKIATAWYILESFKDRLSEDVIVDKDAVTWAPVHLKRTNSEKYPSYWLESGATVMPLVAGEVLPAQVLLHGHMLISGNDASNALAIHYGGTVRHFMEGLNQFLQAKGLKKTYFDNPHGLHHESHVTTAREMAWIAAHAIQNPAFLQLFGSSSYERPASNKQGGGILRQSNRMMIPGKWFYAKAIGGKTGHHAKAGYTYVAAAKEGERTLIAVVLGCKEVSERYRDVKTLFEAGFQEKKVTRTLLTAHFDRFPIQIPGARETLHAKMDNDVTLEYFPSEEPTLRAAIRWNIPPLPIAAGTLVGELVLYDQKNSQILTEPLFAESAITPTLWKRFCSSKGLPMFTAFTLLGLFYWYFFMHARYIDRGSKIVP
jgi:D-alanyl-D-alanine carboxypeptidase (penicillin-binding protein 5/6)